MKVSSTLSLLALTATLGIAATSAQAATIAITEWMYNPATGSGEFVEFTNMTNASISMSGWSFDDNSRTPGSQSLSAFGSIGAGESVIFTELTEAAFRTRWSLAAGVKVIGGNTNNLGRSDEINLYDASNALVDRLTYNDEDSNGGPRTSGTSGRPKTVSAIGANLDSDWILSTPGDVEGSYQSAVAQEYGSPGKTSFAPATVPLPAAAWLLLSGLGLTGRMLRRPRKPA